MLELYPQAIHSSCGDTANVQSSSAREACYWIGMRKLSILLGLSAWTLLTGAALGQDKAKPEAKSAKGDGVTVGEDGVRRDRKGI